MYLLEHDAKQFLARHGIPVPQGRLFERDATLHRAAIPEGPWMVKGQLAAGGRGKAGLIRKAATMQELADHTNGILGATVKGRTVEAVRIERQVTGAEEAYVGLLLDAGAGGIRVILSAQGGMDVENLPPGAIRSEVAAPDAGALAACVARLAAAIEGPKGKALAAAGQRLARVFLECEAMLIEVNPLFVHPDGSWIAGDAKVVTDDNALPRQEALRALVRERADAYREVARKEEHGCDYVVVDPGGEIGLLTTGAGLSMMLIDELRAAGLKPYNFLDVRTGGLRGEITRLVQVLQWLTEGRNVKVLLVNIFAGITDLAEFSKLLVAALAAVPALKVPVVARLVGNGLPAAREVLSAAGIALHTDLDEALNAVRAHLKK
ncbi:MAG TPA: ATP-grasp domain-containing protein [Burkholderiales bacterium]|nr:ATP-grasp domain-containing protein [Burkholderiales bacterium]